MDLTFKYISSAIYKEAESAVAKLADHGILSKSLGLLKTPKGVVGLAFPHEFILLEQPLVNRAFLSKRNGIRFLITTMGEVLGSIEFLYEGRKLKFLHISTPEGIHPFMKLIMTFEDFEKETSKSYRVELIKCLPIAESFVRLRFKNHSLFGRVNDPEGEPMNFRSFKKYLSSANELFKHTKL